MTDIQNPYLLKALVESNAFYGASFSNRYMNWKRNYSMRKVVAGELKRLGDIGPIKILDIGCGNGTFIYRLKAQFSKKYQLQFIGVDISKFEIDFANQKKEYFSYQDCAFLVMDAQDLKFNNEEFDIIISSEVIEHLPEPQSFVSQIYRVLKKGGCCIITTPQKNGGLLTKLVRRIKGAKIIEHIPDFIDPVELNKMTFFSEQGALGAGFAHISVKSKNEWSQIFLKQGFKIESLQGTDGLLFGAPYLDKHRIIFAFSVIFDVILEKLPLSYLWSEGLLFKLKK